MELFRDESGQYFTESNGVMQPLNDEQVYDVRKKAAFEQLAKDTSPMQAGLVSMGERMFNMFDKLGIIDGINNAPDNMTGSNIMNDQRASEGAMGALQAEHPGMTTAGSVAPYLAAATLAIGSLPIAAGVGAVEGALYADPGDELVDATVGAVAPGIGIAGVKLAQKTGKLLGRVGRTTEKAADVVEDVPVVVGMKGAKPATNSKPSATKLGPRSRKKAESWQRNKTSIRPIQKDAKGRPVVWGKQRITDIDSPWRTQLPKYKKDDLGLAGARVAPAGLLDAFDDYMKQQSEY